MKIAIVTDQPRRELLLGEEGLQKQRQSKETIRHIKEALSAEYDVINLEADDNLIENLFKEKVDLVFNLTNSIKGKDNLSRLPSLLEYLEIPYTGSRPLAHGLAYNKILSGKIFEASNIPTPRFICVESTAELEDVNLTFPLIVKPKDEGSSRGIHDDSLVFDKNSLIEKVKQGLEHYHPPMMIMEYIEGREFTVGILGNYDKIQVLPILEIDFSNLPGLNRIYSFEAKFKYDEYLIFHLPAKLDKETKYLIETTAVKAFNSLGLRDYARVDMRLKDGVAYVIEVNSLPGLHKDASDICKMSKAAGIEYNELIKRIVLMGINRG